MLFLTDLTKKQEMFQIVTNLITSRTLFSPILLQSCYQFHESGSDNIFQRYLRRRRAAASWIWFNRKQIHSIRRPKNPTPETKHGSDNTLRRYRRFFLAHAHFRHIFTSRRSSGNEFRIAHRISYSSLIVSMALSDLNFYRYRHGTDRRQTHDSNA